MSAMKTVGMIALLLGMLVLMVAAYLSFSNAQFMIEPFALGAAAILAGFVCIKKAQEIS